MPRAQRRTWVKLYCYERLHGSIAFQLEPEERSTFDELLCLAGICGLDGLIADHDRRPYPHSFIAHECHISEELLERTLDKCKEEGRIKEDEHGIYLTNWATYQSEYQRQKPYREGKKSGKKIHKICPSCSYKALTDEDYCPKCAQKGKESELQRDYKAGKYGHMVQE